MLLVKCGYTRRYRWCSPGAKERLPAVVVHPIPPGGMRPRRWSHSDELLTPRVGTIATSSTSKRSTRARGCCRGLLRLNRRLPSVLPHPAGPWRPRRYDGATLFYS